MIIRREKTEDYSIIANECFRNPKISGRAKGIYGYLMTLPNTWELNKKELLNHFTEGRDALNTAFDELVSFGYIHENRVRDEKGKFIGWEYVVHEFATRVTENPKSDKAENGKPVTGKPKSENPHLLNTNKEVNTEEVNTDSNNNPIVPLIIEPYFGYENCSQDCKRKANSKINDNLYCGQHQRIFLKEQGCLVAEKESNKKDSDVEVIKANDITREVIGYLNQAVNKNFKPTNRVYQQHIQARVNEGYTLEDFKQVIEIKTKQWICKPDMARYLRPQTLFGTKMDVYLNEPKPMSKIERAMQGVTL
ncbi:conserved phage C-terminal domain-containing protein [Candidatus Francisella endociliophora]|uniref:conserved phage C-terminal domain-containing protein n=1 Tax=Candidatus Francisella endociliophora TaxID=653937 RepID=UPI0006934842|nr:conserved phage C-terminal domain-containing protein [Francisella sp. FSC1006]